MKSIRLFLLWSLVFYLLSMSMDFIASNVGNVHVGKDNGLIFRIIATSIISSIYFFMIKKKRVLRNTIVGFLVGLLSYFLTFLCSLILSILIKNDNSGWDVRLLYYQLCATTFIVIIGSIFIWHSDDVV